MKQNKNVFLTIRVAEADRERWRQKAERQGLTLSEFVRQLLENAQ